MATAVITDLSAEKPVNVELPGGGRLYIERRLPLLCVYRDVPDDADTAHLLSAEPAYMIVPAGGHNARKALKLLRSVVEYLAQECGSFLLIEIWPDRESETAP